MSRMDVLVAHGLKEVIRRLNMYSEAGADLLFADAVLSVDHISTIVRNVLRPLAVNMGFGIQQRDQRPCCRSGSCRTWEVAVIIYPRLLIAAAIRGMTNAIAVLKESFPSDPEVVDRPDLLVPFEELNDLVAIKEPSASSTATSRKNSFDANTAVALTRRRPDASARYGGRKLQ